MRKVLSRALFGVGAIGATSFGTAYYMFPEIRQDYTQLFKATERIMRLSGTGLHMAYIYGIVTALKLLKITSKEIRSNA